jgi:hypothetical protein
MKRNFRPLEEDVADQLRKMRAGQCTTDLAKNIGINRSTLTDALRPGHAINSKTRAILTDFVKGKTAKPDAILPTTVRGDEKPEVSALELAVLQSNFSVGVNVLLPVLKRLFEIDSGTRIAFHKAFSKEIDELHTLGRALTSESVHAVVKKELEQ